MGIQFTLIAEGNTLDEKSAETTLNALSDLSLERVGPERGAIDTAVKIVRWVLDFAGDVTKIAETLSKLANNQPPGVSIKMKVGDKEVSVENLSQDRLLEMFREMQKAMEKVEDL